MENLFVGRSRKNTFLIWRGLNFDQNLTRRRAETTTTNNNMKPNTNHSPHHSYSGIPLRERGRLINVHLHYWVFVLKRKLIKHCVVNSPKLMRFQFRAQFNVIQYISDTPIYQDMRDATRIFFMSIRTINNST